MDVVTASSSAGIVSIIACVERHVYFDTSNLMMKQRRLFQNEELKLPITL